MMDPVAAMQAQRNLQRRELAAAADLGAGAVAKQMMQEEEMAKTHQDAFVILCKQISPVLISYISIQDHWLYIT